MAHSRFLVATGALLLAPALASAQTKTWTTDADFDSGVKVQVVHPPANQLQLGPTPVLLTNETWACDTANGVVVKIDSNTGKQKGRYDVALQTINGVATGAAPEFGANWPRRVAVDNNGDVWIPNAAFGGGQGTASKFSGFSQHCIDRNHNGVIDTSVDANGDGIINTFDPKEYYGQNDECILTTFPVPVGVPNSVPRGVAIDRNGKVWISTFNTCKVYRYNPNEPVTLEATISVPCNPYSLSTGGQYLQVGISGGGQAVRINIDTLQVDIMGGCPGFYGALMAHPTNNQVFFGGNDITRADWNLKTCQTLNQPMSSGQYIYTVTIDGDFNVWGANISNAFIAKWGPAGNYIATYTLPGSAHGLSVDFNGFVWANGYSIHDAIKVDHLTGKVVGQYPYDCPGCPNPAGLDYTSYLYSDFTGFQVNRQAPYVLFGTWTGTFDGGVAGIPWSKVNFNTEVQGAIPCDNVNNRCTGLKMYARAADDMNTLATVGFTPVANGAALNGIVGEYVQVEADLNGIGYLTPVLSDVTVVGPCGQGIGDNCCLRDSDCDDGNPCTVDNCPMPAGQCLHTPKMACCNVDGDCNDGNACTVDKCPVPGGMCTNVLINGCCNSNADCNDNNACTTDKCSGKGGTCSHPPMQGCCNSNVDCDDGNSCTIDLCSGAGGTCSHFSRGDCCNQDQDCDDQNACTTDKCSGPGGSCTHTPQVNCCNVDADCNTNMNCTVDTCTGPGGTCLHTPKMNCCTGAQDCDDKNACTSDDCSKGTCTHTAIVRCCNMDSECNDNNVCTTDMCSGPGGSCVHALVAGCCNLNSDCDDHDPCTIDKCSGSGGTCTHSAVGAGCCKVDSDCDDQNACTTDRCNGGSTCDHAPLANCYCNSDGECPTNQQCVEHACQPPVGDGGASAALPSNFASGSGTFGGCSTGGRPSSPLAATLLLGVLVLALTRRRLL